MQVALAGAAGFAVSHFAEDLSIGFPWGAILGVAVATILGFVAGVSALRVRGVSLAVVTLAAAVAIGQFGFENQTFGAGQTGAPVPQPTFLGIDLGADAGFRGLDGNLPSPVLGFVILAITSPRGAPRRDDRRRAAWASGCSRCAPTSARPRAGINVRNTKFAGFAIASCIAGWPAGCTPTPGLRSPGRFSVLTALGLVAFAYVGGITMVTGALFAGLLATEGSVAGMHRHLRPLRHLDPAAGRRHADPQPHLLPPRGRGLAVPEEEAEGAREATGLGATYNAVLAGGGDGHRG